MNRLRSGYGAGLSEGTPQPYRRVQRSPIAGYGAALSQGTAQPYRGVRPSLRSVYVPALGAHTSQYRSWGMLWCATAGRQEHTPDRLTL